MESEREVNPNRAAGVTADEAHARINSMLDTIVDQTRQLDSAHEMNAKLSGQYRELAASFAQTLVERDEWRDQCQAARAALDSCKARADQMTEQRDAWMKQATADGQRAEALRAQLLDMREAMREPYEAGRRDATESIVLQRDYVEREKYDELSRAADALVNQMKDERDAAVGHALTVVLDTLDGWVEGARSNHDALGHGGHPAGEECWQNFHVLDIKTMVEDARRELAGPVIRVEAETLADKTTFVPYAAHVRIVAQLHDQNGKLSSERDAALGIVSNLRAALVNTVNALDSINPTTGQEK